MAWFWAPGLAMYRAGYGATLFIGGAVMFPAVYELSYRLPTLADSTSWPWNGFIATGTPWAEALWGIYIWLLLCLSILGIGVRTEVRRRGSYFFTTPIGINDPSDYNNNDSHTFETRGLLTVENSLLLDGDALNQQSEGAASAVKAVQQVVYRMAKATPITSHNANPKQSLSAKIVRGILQILNVLHLFLTLASFVLLIYTIIENRFGYL